jgi:hypothetical protein
MDARDVLAEAFVAMGDGRVALVERELGDGGGVVDRVAMEASPVDDAELRTLLDAF